MSAEDANQAPATTTAAEEGGEENLQCSHCGKLVDGEYMSGEDGLLLHADCVEEWQANQESATCAHCGEIIDGEYVEAEDIVSKESVDLHETCLAEWLKATRPNCAQCGEQIIASDYGTLGDDLYHEGCKIVAEEQAAAAATTEEGDEPTAAEADAEGGEEEDQEEEATTEEEEEAGAPAAEGEEEAADAAAAQQAAEDEEAQRKALEEEEARFAAEAVAEAEAAQLAVAAEAEAASIAAKEAEEKQKKEAEGQKTAAIAAKATPTPPESSAKTSAAKAAAGDKKKTAPAPAAGTAKKAAPKKSFARKSTVGPAPAKPSAKPSSTAAAAAKKTDAQEESGAEKNEEGEPVTEKEVEEEEKKPDPKKNLDEFDETLTVPGMTTTSELFRSLDMNGNGMLSLAELDKAIVQVWPKFNSKPAIMRAYKAADKNGTGFVSKKEFEYFLEYIVLYHNTWVNFSKIDTSGDRRLSEQEFIDGAVKIGIEGETEESLKSMFDDMDKNDGGIVLFDEFCAAFAQKKAVLRQPTPPQKPKAQAYPKTARPAPPVAALTTSTLGATRDTAKSAGKEFGTTNQSAMSGGAKSARSSAYNKPYLNSPLAQPKHKPAPPPPATPDEIRNPGPPRKKIRLVGDPSVEALEAKVRERKAAERLRHEQMHAKALAMQEEFDRREKERAEEKEKIMEAERRAKDEDFNRKRQEREAAEIARQQRLAGVLKCDMDVIAGKKSISDKFAERAAELKRQEEEDLLAAREHRKQVCVMGPNFYSGLKDHEQKLKARAEMEAKERQTRRQEVTAVPPLPQEYQTRVRQAILQSDEQKRIEIQNSAAIGREKRAQTMAYADGAQKENMPKNTRPFVPPELKKAVARESKNTRSDGNNAIRSSKGVPHASPAPAKAAAAAPA